MDMSKLSKKADIAKLQIVPDLPVQHKKSGWLYIRVDFLRPFLGLSQDFQELSQDFLRAFPELSQTFSGLSQDFPRTS